jgi:hypothetical protein
VGVVVTTVEGGLVDRLGPGAGSPGVVGEGRHGVAEPLVARPAEVDGFVLAGLLGDRCGTAEGSDGFRAVEGFATIAPLGEHLGGVDLPRSWQRPEDLGVRVLVEVGGNGAVEVLDRPHQGTQGTDHGEHGISAGFGFGPSGDAGGSGSEPFDELGGGTPPGVAVLGEERGHAGFADAGGGGRGRVGSCRPSTPRPALCERWYAAAPTSSTSASPPTSSKRSWTRSGVGLHRHRRMAGLQQPVHQAAIGSFGRHRHLGRIAVASQTCGEPIKALRAVGDGERSTTRPSSSRTHTACSSDAQSIRASMSSPWSCGSTTSMKRTSPGRSLIGALRRAPVLPVIRPRRTGGGGVIVALEGQPSPAVTPTLIESQEP